MRVTVFAILLFLAISFRSSHSAVLSQAPVHKEALAGFQDELELSESLVPKSRQKRFFGSIANALVVNLLPLPVLPTNFIGIQVTIVPPKNRRNTRRRG
eukprot:TRINITY_DN12175_c0_g1_i1.p1 TRINITY_DN12175_c0_g1~~TRINITY_DN12175_c0_g1_i1.p1  ORF type:complete len:110 (-),score=6.56 TRINITY_DN12175_c0_g1_i1:90-386(-)